MLLTLAAVIGVAAAAAVAVSARDDGSQPAAAAASCRALSGRPPLALDLPGAALPPQEQNNDAVLRAAERRLPAGDVRISVGRLVNAYGSAGAAATLRGLQRARPVAAGGAAARGAGAAVGGRLHGRRADAAAGANGRPLRLLRHRCRQHPAHRPAAGAADLHPARRHAPAAPSSSCGRGCGQHPDDGPSWLGLAYGEEVGGQPAGGAGGRQAGPRRRPHRRLPARGGGRDRLRQGRPHRIVCRAGAAHRPGQRSHGGAVPPGAAALLAQAGHRRRLPSGGRSSRSPPARSTARSRLS